MNFFHSALKKSCLPYDITAGVLHGDTLAPYQFAIVLDRALKEALNGHKEIFGLQYQQTTKQESETGDAHIPRLC